MKYEEDWKYNYPMTVDEIYTTIATQKPPVIYVSGKTSTGKSTFGRKLRDDLGYRVIELEAVLLEIVKEHKFDEQSTFRKVLYEPGEFKEKMLFLEATDKIITDALNNNHPVVIEGAIANVETLQRILSPAKELFFLYFHPSDITIYIRNLTSRFMESSETSYGGLPSKFWQLIDTEEFTIFCQTHKLTEGLKSAIARYAQDSQEESLARLETFKEKFDNITMIGIE